MLYVEMINFRVLTRKKAEDGVILSAAVFQRSEEPALTEVEGTRAHRNRSGYARFANVRGYNKADGIAHE